MNVRREKAVLIISVLVVGLVLAGCEQQGRRGENELAPKIELGTTIGSLAEVFAFDTIAVEGYGLVGGLNQTGSAECPPAVRAYLKQYILKKLPGHKNVNALIDGSDTAVVVVKGLMPAAAYENQQRFDIRVEALLGTQTTSLEGGWLYGAELKVAGRFSTGMKTLATAQGPVFIDTIETPAADKKVGYILGGGRGLDDYKIRLALRKPDYRLAGLIRDRLNERFGVGTARAISAGQIELKVPAKYREQKQRFISIVKATYLTQNRQTMRARVITFVGKLATSDDKYASEIALEAVGNASVGKLAALLNSLDQEVRLRAARCMLNLGSDEGLEVLREIAMDEDSGYRFEAIEAIAAAASRNDAAFVSRRLLQDEDFNVRLAAYETLRKINDISIAQRLVARSFYLEQIAQSKHKTIFVCRSGQPRIVLFGAPLYCREGIFVRSADGNVTINAPAGQKYISIIRKHPTRPNVIRLKSSFELGDIIRTLCEEPLKRTKEERAGLGVSYAEVIALLKQMCDKGVLQAEFRAGPLPKIVPIVKRKQTIGR